LKLLYDMIRQRSYPCNRGCPFASTSLH